MSQRLQIKLILNYQHRTDDIGEGIIVNKVPGKIGHSNRKYYSFRYIKNVFCFLTLIAGHIQS
jgi:hypothetical protein